MKWFLLKILLLFCCFFLVKPCSSPTMDYLVLNLTMDDYSGITVYDQSEYKNNATIYASNVTGYLETNSFYFDGTTLNNGSIPHSVSLTPSTAFSIVAFINISDVKETDGYGRYGRVIDKNLHYAIGVRMGILQVSDNVTSDFVGMHAHQGVAWDYDLDRLLMVSTYYMTLWDFNGTLIANQTLVTPPNCTKGNAPCYFNGSFYIPMTDYPNYPGNASIVEYNATDLANTANFTITGIPQNVSNISSMGRNYTDWWLGTGPFYSDRLSQGRSCLYKFDDSFTYQSYFINTSRSSMQGFYFPNLNSSSWYWNGYGNFYKFNNDTMLNYEVIDMTEGFFINDDWEFWISDDHYHLIVYENETKVDVHFSPRIGYHYYANEQLELNKWYKIAGTFSEVTKQVKLYVNDHLIVNYTLTQPTSDWYSNNVTIGYAPYYNGAYFNGEVDTIQIYNTDIEFEVSYDGGWLPTMFIFGMIGLVSMFTGPMYGIYKWKHGEYYEGARRSILLTAIGIGLTLAWLWTI